MKRKWLMVPLVTGLLAAGLTGATVLAHNDDGEQEAPKDALAAKVAEILGIDEQDVGDALTEARQEVRSERTQHRLNDLVEAGQMTQEEADAYMEWYEARPDGGQGGHGLFGFKRGHGFGGGHRFGGQSFFGQGQLPSGQGGDVPEVSGTSY